MQIFRSLRSTKVVLLHPKLEISVIDRIDSDGIHQLNTIDVGERLATITDALAGVRAIASSATTLEELKSGIAAALTEV